MTKEETVKETILRALEQAAHDNELEGGREPRFAETRDKIKRGEIKIVDVTHAEPS
jgi:hypothetical protein